VTGGTGSTVARGKGGPAAGLCPVRRSLVLRPSRDPDLGQGFEQLRALRLPREFRGTRARYIFRWRSLHNRSYQCSALQEGELGAEWEFMPSRQATHPTGEPHGGSAPGAFRQSAFEDSKRPHSSGRRPARRHWGKL
jgi:hypothetical protein